VEVEGISLTRNIYLARNRMQPLTRAQAKFWEFVLSKRDEMQNTHQIADKQVNTE
jgi:hypothetical protein